MDAKCTSRQDGCEVTRSGGICGYGIGAFVAEEISDIIRVKGEPEVVGGDIKHNSRAAKKTEIRW